MPAGESPETPATAFLLSTYKSARVAPTTGEVLLVYQAADYDRFALVDSGPKKQVYCRQKSAKKRLPSV